MKMLILILSVLGAGIAQAHPGFSGPNPTKIAGECINYSTKEKIVEIYGVDPNAFYGWVALSQNVQPEGAPKVRLAVSIASRAIDVSGDVNASIGLQEELPFDGQDLSLQVANPADHADTLFILCTFKRL